MTLPRELTQRSKILKPGDVPPLIKAVEENNLDNVISLLKSGADAKVVNKSGESCLTVAASKGHSEIMKALIASGTDINTTCPSGKTALMAASLHGHLPIVKLLVDSNADVNISSDCGNTALISAAENGHTDIVELLLMKGADVNAARKDGTNALLLATERGTAPMVRILLERGCNVNAQNNDGFTASLVAADKSQRDVLELLCQFNADMNLPCLYGYTPLFAAVLKHDAAALELIIRSGGDTNLTDNLGLTALMHASWQGRHELVRVFCDLGANVNVQNPNNGRTALHYGVMKKNLTVVECLVEAAACLNVIDRECMTPLNLAVPGKVRDFLVSIGAYECSLKSDSWVRTDSFRGSLWSGANEGSLKRGSCFRGSQLSLNSMTSFEKYYTDLHQVPNKLVATVTYSFNEESSIPGDTSEFKKSESPNASPMLNHKLMFTGDIEPLPISADALAVMPDTQPTVDAFAMDNVKLRDYLQRCVDHFLAQHIAGNGCATVTGVVEREKTEQPANTETHNDVMVVNNITQNISFTIGNAMCVSTGRYGKIFLGDTAMSTATVPEVDYDNEELETPVSGEFLTSLTTSRL